MCIPAISAGSSSAFSAGATGKSADDRVISAALVRRPLPLLDRDLLAELGLQLAQLPEDGVELVVLRVLDVDEAASILLLPLLMTASSQNRVLPTWYIKTLEREVR